jgi:hypothetical protein
MLAGSWWSPTKKIPPIRGITIEAVRPGLIVRRLGGIILNFRDYVLNDLFNKIAF